MQNHDPNYGNNITCAMCGGVFDPLNSTHSVINHKLGPIWICGDRVQGGEACIDTPIWCLADVLDEMESNKSKLHLRSGLHQSARDFMDNNKKPSWKEMSLDEWLMEYGEELADSVRREGYKIMDAFDSVR